MSPRVALVLFLTTACSTAHAPGGPADAAGPGGPDAAPGTIDAAPGSPDAKATPDAFVPLPDAMPTCATTMCDVNAMCSMATGVPVCVCSPGWMGDGHTCTDVDECAAPGACSVYATCTNTPGSHTCMCNAGFSGDGVTCNDVDECAAGTAGCSINATCTNNVGGFTCTCNGGYMGDGFTCMPVVGGCVNIEDFESGVWPAAGWTLTGGTTTGAVATTSAHDGSWGFAGGDFYEKSSPVVGNPGDRITAWVRGSGGRVYLGFSADATGGKSFVIAPNTTEIRFQDNAGWSYGELMGTPQTFLAAHWYKAEIVFNGTTSVTGRLYDSDGVTLLNSLTQTYASVPPGLPYIRSFGGMDIDTLQVCNP